MKQDEIERLMVEAKKKLREDENTRRQALEQFRDWIEKNPDIRDCRTDDIYLLRYLRKGKFSVPTAQEIFLRHANFSETFSHFARRNDFSNPKMNLLLKTGCLYASPFRTKEGCAVGFNIVSRFEPDKYHYTDYLSAAIALNLVTMEDEANQVLGVVVIIDLGGATASHIAQIPVQELLASMKAMQKTFPLRYKGVHIVNFSPIFKWIFDLIVSNLSKKMAGRMFAHTNIEDVHKHIEPRVLPKEFGGDIPEAVMIAQWNEVLESKKQVVSQNDNLRLVHLEDLKTTMAELPGSFRKLEVD